MHAMIRRYDGVTGTTEELMRLGRQQASAVSAVPGFVSYALMEAGPGVLVSVSVFETQAALDAAEQLVESWIAGQPAVLSSRPPQISSGEVIVQRGM
jgi:quinol monooxygenase YgiN